MGWQGRGHRSGVRAGEVRAASALPDQVDAAVQRNQDRREIVGDVAPAQANGDTPQGPGRRPLHVRAGMHDPSMTESVSYKTPVG